MPKKNIVSFIKEGYQKQIKRISLEELKNVPNVLTLFRISSVPVIAILYILGTINPVFMIAAISLFGTSAFTDCLDGIIARKFNLQTETGKVLDAFADKFFLLSLIPMFFFPIHQIIPLLLGAISINEIIISCVNGYGSYHDCPVSSSMIGKIKTWFLFASGGLLLISSLIPTLLPIAIMVSFMNIYLELKTATTYLTTYQREIYQQKQKVLEKENQEKEKTYKKENTHDLSDKKISYYYFPTTNYEQNKIKTYKKTGYYHK